MKNNRDILKFNVDKDMLELFDKDCGTLLTMDDNNNQHNFFMFGVFNPETGKFENPKNM